MEFTVYILYSSKCDKYYVGQTNDLEKRVYEHNNIKEENSLKFAPLSNYSTVKSIVHALKLSNAKGRSKRKKVGNTLSR